MHQKRVYDPQTVGGMLVKNIYSVFFTLSADYANFNPPAGTTSKTTSHWLGLG